MGSKLLFFLALVAAGVLVFVVVSSMSDDRFDPGKGRAVRPDEEDAAIVAPPPLGEEARSDAVAGAAGTLAVLVTDEANHPIAGARISTSIDGMPEAARQAVTDGAGRAVIEGLPDGRQVSVQARGELTRLPATEVVEVAAGVTVETHLVLCEGGALTGTVLGPGGAPIGVPYRVEVVATRSAPGPDSFAHRQVMSRQGRPVAGEEFAADVGVFSVGGLKAGNYVARASAAGYLDNQSEPFEVVKGSIRDGVRITLERGARLSGVVVRGRTGEPVAGALVSLGPSGLITLGGAGGSIRMAGAKQAETDELGRFAIEGVAPGDYTVTASAKDLAWGRAENVKVEKGRDAEGVMISLGEGGAITGTVYGPDGRPVPNARVQITRVNPDVQVFGSFGGNVKADGKGVFHSDHLEPGRYRVKLATGGVTASASVTIVMAGSVGGPKEEPEEKPLGPDEVMVYEGQVTTHDILSPMLCTITGTVADEEGVPHEGQVRLEPLDVENGPREDSGVRIDIPRIANPNAKGEFSFTGLLPGRYALHTAGAREEVSLIPGGTSEVRIIVRPARVEGVVYDPDGEPVARARVYLKALDRERAGPRIASISGGTMSLTDERGQFTLENVTAGRYRATATHDRQTGQSAEFEVGPGATRRNIRIDLEPLTEIRVEVRDRDGKPLANATVMLRDGEQIANGGRTDANGVVILRALPGTYTLTIRGPGSEQAERELQVGRGTTQSVSLRTE